MTTAVKNKLTVIDFFSGAGGFSEGFRQQGFSVIKGIDFWEPAVKTHNLNHGLEDTVENVLDYFGSKSDDVERIESLADTDVIVGSPSCVTFSMSNKGGKADKTEGLRLIYAYLRVVAVKKHKKDSQLKAWLMENVPNSGNYVQKVYTFTDLNLKLWASNNGINPDSIALTLNGVVLNASDYGAPQNRKRFICGESVRDGKFPLPSHVGHAKILLKDIKSKMPKPNLKKPTGKWQDPNYPSLVLSANEISDHFYDTGLYALDWEQARNLKITHPFMGKMSFPEDDNRSSRTVTATRSVSSREALIYKSEYRRNGHGEYRTPTVREAASLMGYPYTYQFFGSESSKWKLIGNSVSPQVSSALAKAILIKENVEPIELRMVDFSELKSNHHMVNNLNVYRPIAFDKIKQRRENAKFRRAVFKGQNMTVDLLNYHPDTKDYMWSVATFYGTGGRHEYDVLTKRQFSTLMTILSSKFSLFDDFVAEIDDVLGEFSHNSSILQKAYEQDSLVSDPQNPLLIIRDLKRLYIKYGQIQPDLRISLSDMKRESFTLPQLLCLFSLGKMVYNETQRQISLDMNNLKVPAIN